ncbi:MAG: esterase/lipase family protein, partial [Acidimicrobiia bacterium]
GTTGGPTGGHPPGFHFGLRRGEEYLDPMLLFRPTDLARVVHLAPVAHAAAPAGGSWAVESLGVWRGLDIPTRMVPGSPPGGADAPGAAGGGVLGAIGSWLEGAADAGTAIARSLPGASDAEAVAGRLLDAGRSRLDCTSSPPEADGTGGSGHLLMAVGGMNSSTDPDSGATFGLPSDALGYQADEITWYSYAADGGAYAAADTHGRIHLAARRLAEQLRALHAREPGREIDLVAHSQGGVVVDEFLQHLYDAADPTFPALGTVVTLSSPHQGAPLATAAHQIGATDTGQGALSVAAGAGLPARAPALEDLRENSRTMRELWRERLPEHVDFTTIGAVGDVVVPASQTAVPGAKMVLVNPEGPLDHSAVTNDDEALAAVRLALEGRPPACPSVLTTLRGAIEPLVITRLERVAGQVARAAGEAADASGRVADRILP